MLGGERFLSSSKPSAVERVLKFKSALPYIVLLLPVFLLFGDVLFARGEWVASHAQYDVKCLYGPFRAFGYGEIAKGHLPLWDPHIYSGSPFLASYQSALYYPLNLPYLFLPLSDALNIEIVLHVYLMGALMYAWSRNRGLSAIAALFVAMVVQFSGPYFLRVLAGHVSYLRTCVTPLAFLRWTMETRWARRCDGVTMTILAGHPLGVLYAQRWFRTLAFACCSRATGCGPPRVGALAWFPP